MLFCICVYLAVQSLLQLDVQVILIIVPVYSIYEFYPAIAVDKFRNCVVFRHSFVILGHVTGAECSLISIT